MLTHTKPHTAVVGLRVCECVAHCVRIIYLCLADVLFELEPETKSDTRKRLHMKFNDRMFGPPVYSMTNYKKCVSCLSKRDERKMFARINRSN